MTQIWDIAVIGAGAAGLAAGIFAAETTQAVSHAPRIVLLDSAKKLGAKILVSGGGRCNVTHHEVHPEDFNGSRNIVRNVLAAFDAHAAVRWFESLSVSLKQEETGKLFPVSDSARIVLNALLRRCAELGITLLTQHRVFKVSSPNLTLSPSPLAEEGWDGRVSQIESCPSPPHPGPLSQRQKGPAHEAPFLIQHEQGTLHARRVIMATGGRSLPRTGSDGSGWEIVRSLGHTVTETYPALVPVVLRNGAFHTELSGISLEVEVSTFADGKVVDRRTGSLLWTHFGVSGPVVMDASRHWIRTRAKGQAAELRCNFFPGQSFAHVEKQMLDTASSRPRLSLGRMLGEHVPERFAATLLRWTDLEPTSFLNQLSREGRRRLVHALTNFLLPVEHERGWNFAEVTAGGVPLQEIDYRTMASRKVPGLYLVGEMLDCDGRIGGFNFHWAWATGFLAGRAAAKR
ncbi:MAG: NAD(P)/FAD-dependent oxidoreductase [Candidatus Binatia bacterium]